jgi:two-component sensor histidine kinase
MYSEVLLREEKKTVPVKIAENKPEIPVKIQHKWQLVLDTLAKVLNVPSSLIMQIDSQNMRVFLKGNTPDNPYTVGGSDLLGHGLYCETVIGRNRSLIVPNSLTDENWVDNPDVKLNMISYLGFPLKWPDGEFFGTICVLDNKENNFSSEYKNLLSIFKGIIEVDLERELENYELTNQKLIYERNLSEIHHRIKNQFSMIISYIHLLADRTDIKSDSILEEVENRINAVYLLHQKLYQQDQIDRSVSSYLTELADLLIDTISNKTIHFTAEIDDIPLTDTVLDFGVVLAELISNSVKYAFENIDEPEITVAIHRVNDSVKIFYKDNGNGFEESDSKSGIGTMLINSFADRNAIEMKHCNNYGSIYEFDCRATIFNI